MRARPALSQSEELEEINISPLIDMVFILLIFFIVTTVFVEEPGIDVDKPRAVSGQKLKKNSILLALTSSGAIMYGGKDIGVNGVQPIVRRILASGDVMPVILQIDKAVEASRILRVVDEAKMGGAVTVSVSTQTGA